MAVFGQRHNLWRLNVHVHVGVLKLSLNNGCGHIHACRYMYIYVHACARVCSVPFNQFTRQSPHKPIATPSHDGGEFPMHGSLLYSVVIVLFTWYTPSCLIAHCVYLQLPSCNIKASPVYTCLPWYTPSCMHACKGSDIHVHVYDSSIVL